MSSLFIGSVCGVIIVNTYIQYHKIKKFNNEIIEQREAINKITSICKKLSISKILNHTDNYIISYVYITIDCIIIIIIDIILLLIMIFNPTVNIINVILILIPIILIVLLIIINVNHNYIKINEEYINNKGIEIINKKDEISNNYYKTLLYIVNTNETDDIDYIISHINEYILNHSHLFNIYINMNGCNMLIKSIKDTKTILNDITNDLIKNKKDNLAFIINVKFKTVNKITHEIVKNELDKYDNDLEIYKKSLELKIKNVNDLLRINEIMASI
jgi:hypothetical protein